MSSSGLKLFTVVGVVFIILKLVKVITWSWVWVLCPFWIGYAFLLVVFILGLIFAGAIQTFMQKKMKKKQAEYADIRARKEYHDNINTKF